MTDSQVAAYRDGWRRHLLRVLDQVQPDVIHAHHLWILGSVIKDLEKRTVKLEALIP